MTARAAGRAGGVGGTRADQSERSNGAMGVVRNGAWFGWSRGVAWGVGDNLGTLGWVWGHFGGLGKRREGGDRPEVTMTP